MFVESFTGTDLFSRAKGGLMIRKSLNTNSRHFSLFVTGSDGLRTQIRSINGGSTSKATTQDLPNNNIWLKITKEGNEFQAYYKSSTDADWSTFGSLKTIVFGDTPFYVGIAVTSHDNSKTATITSSNWYWSSTLGSSQSVMVRFPLFHSILDSIVSHFLSYAHLSYHFRLKKMNRTTWILHRGFVL